MSESYGLSNSKAGTEFTAPILNYLPRLPKIYRPEIALIGCGGITEYHLRNYAALGFNVVAICDLDEKQAIQRRDEFYPEAEIFTDAQSLIEKSSAEVIDVAVHPKPRVKIIESALRSGKHVLSQKPFVDDLEVGRKLIALADEHKLKLAVNQNGRWAPHFSYITQCIQKGIVGKLSSIDFSLQWDHTWIESTPFNEIHHLILYDFGIHWFDILSSFTNGEKAKRVTASINKVPFQKIKPPMSAHVLVEYESLQASMSFNGHVKLGQQDQTTICGENATIRSTGPSLTEQELTLYTDKGYAVPKLEGDWFSNGFQGTMCELLCGIEEDQEPSNSAAKNLNTLELCFAAVKSANQGGEPINIRQLHHRS